MRTLFPVNVYHHIKLINLAKRKINQVKNGRAAEAITLSSTDRLSRDCGCKVWNGSADFRIQQQPIASTSKLVNLFFFVVIGKSFAS